MNFESIGKKIDDIDVTISSRIIELFSAGLYSSPNKAFEELICNSYDALLAKSLFIVQMTLQFQMRIFGCVIMERGWMLVS